MNSRTRMTLLAATLAGTTFLVAGCGEQSADRYGATTDGSTSTASSAPPASTASSESVGQTIDRTTSMVAAATDKAAAAVDDTVITGMVKAAIVAEPGLRTTDISVETKDGVVTLSGAVNSPLDKERAVHVAQAVSGVVSVVDQLSLKSTG